MRAWTSIFFLASLIFPVSTPGLAASLSTMPVTIEVKAPGAAEQLSLRNEGEAPLTAQIRVFRWSQVNGVDRLEPTTDVVASPPMTSIGAKSEQIIRIVRIAKRPLGAEETYRVLVDEMPAPRSQKVASINIAMRYSIPVFFTPPAGGQYALSWALERRDGKVFIAATNNGDRRVRLSQLSLKDQSGAEVTVGKGLIGYVLARSSMRFAVSGNVQSLGIKGPVHVTASGDQGPINAQAQTSAGR